jgi:hypothetical protein
MGVGLVFGKLLMATTVEMLVAAVMMRLVSSVVLIVLCVPVM